MLEKKLVSEVYIGAAAGELAHQGFELLVGAALRLRAGDVAIGAAQSLLDELIDLLGDAGDRDTGAFEHAADLLSGSGREIGHFAAVARRVRIRHVLADDLQADVDRLQ